MTWELTPLKKITTKIGSGATPRGGNSAYKTEGITLIRSLNVHDFEFRYEGLAFINEEQASETRLARVIVEPQDILLNITGASVARCCIVPEHLLPARVNQHVSLVRVDPNHADSRYVLYCINSPVYKHQLLTLAQGGATREALTQKIIGNLEIPLPPIPTQRKIANFLERKTQQISELIRIKVRRIELLQEQRTALINQVVTKGLDPNVEMQPSGVEWIGKIPVHWKIVRGKFILSHKKEINSDFQCNNLLSLTLNGVLRRDMNSTEGLIPNDYRTYQIFYPNNLVFKLIDLENIKTSRVGIVPEQGIMSPVYIRLEGTSNSHEKYYFYQYYDLYKNHIFNFLGKGVRSSLSPSDLLDIPLVFPPLSEQRLIANFLDHKTEQIDELISIEQRKIELLKEYRQSLISEAVTGKIDVRNEV